MMIASFYRADGLVAYAIFAGVVWLLSAWLLDYLMRK